MADIIMHINKKMPTDVKEHIYTFLPNINAEQYNKCISLLKHRFIIMDNIIKFALKNQVSLAKFLLKDNYDKLIYCPLYLIKYYDEN